jgi:hypothetical protein
MSLFTKPCTVKDLHDFGWNEGQSARVDGREVMHIRTRYAADRNTPTGFEVWFCDGGKDAVLPADHPAVIE